MTRQTKDLLPLFLVLTLVVMAGCARAQIPAPVLDPAPEGSFSIVVIPDTQDYFGPGTRQESAATDAVTNPVFEAHTRWIIENIESQHIVFVSHVGDIVDRNEHGQWRVARACMDRLHGIIPYGLSVGNHDMTSDGDSSLFQEHFPADHFSGFDWYGGCFPGDSGRPSASGNNANSFQLFTAEGIGFVSLHLECNAPDNVLEWANGVLEEHADRWALITTHMDLGPVQRPPEAEGYYDDPKGRMEWVKNHGERGNSPRQMWEKCFRLHKNVLMICSGDQRRSAALYMTSTGEHGNTVHALMSDYSPLSAKQQESFKTSALAGAISEQRPRWDPLRIYRFLPDEEAIEVITFDTMRGALIDGTATVPDRGAHQFRIQNVPLRRSVSKETALAPG